MISKSLEEYLKTIYIIQKQNKQPRVTDIAGKMNCTKASVNKSLKILTEQKLIKYEPYGKIELTDEGTKLAKKILEANDIVYVFLKELLGEEQTIAEEEAKEIKMVMKDTTLNKLAKYVHQELGLYSLDCGYDINNEHCIDCARRRVENE
jgi:DtxR family Mn-dependent transcriptional regulator